MTHFPRSSGILLHPTSLPGRYGIGDLGEWAYRFVDWLVAHGQSIWQVLPLGPTSYGDSPYQTLSAFAGNPLLISLDKLAGYGWLTAEDLADVPPFPADRVDYGWVIDYHFKKLFLAYERFASGASPEQKNAFEAWCADNAFWLEDFALFIALKDAHGGRAWVEWDEPYALRDEAALAKAREEHKLRIAQHRFIQWQFHAQWLELKRYANERGVRIIGDIPIFVAHDSADVWANPDKFALDEKGRPTVVAGVPPDYFSPTGQRWGNPLYRWDVMAENGYEWWISRFRQQLTLTDILRIDHFRGFEAYWEIPASEPTAVVGEWKPGPRFALFEAVREALGELPIIAEDLGIITPGVEQLRDGLGFPGMKVLQFAWSDPKNPFLPHNHVPNCVVYSGTHDNNTTVGWWHEETDDHVRNIIKDYIQCDVYEANWMLIRLGMASVAHTFIAPMQDILGLGKEARMNTPGQQGGNWQWRLQAHDFDNPGKDRLAHFTWLYQRRPDQQERVYGDVAVNNGE